MHETEASLNSIPLACADFSFPLLPHDLALGLIAGLGIEGVDISLMLSNSHLPVKDVIAKPSAWARTVASRLDRHGLALADVNFAPGADFQTRAVNHPDAAVRREARDWFSRALEFTVGAGGRHFTMLPGVRWPNEDSETALGRAAEELAWRIEEGLKAGVTVSIEAHLGSLVPTPADAVRLIQLTPRLTLTLDYTHFVYQGFADMDCEALLPYASHFHARGGHKGRLQAPMKKNSIDYAHVLHAMKEVGYLGYFAIEYVWIDWENCNDVDNISETVLMRDLANQYR
jgi:sugar phosphate isomerase/epimerase